MGSQCHITKTIQDTLNPKWNSNCQFFIRDLEQEVLCITVFERDQFSPDGEWNAAPWLCLLPWHSFAWVNVFLPGALVPGFLGFPSREMRLVGTRQGSVSPGGVFWRCLTASGQSMLGLELCQLPWANTTIFCFPKQVTVERGIFKSLSTVLSVLGKKPWWQWMKLANGTRMLAQHRSRRIGQVPLGGNFVAVIK